MGYTIRDTGQDKGVKLTNRALSRDKLMMLCHCRVAVSLQMVEEYDSFCKDFRKAVHENQDQGNLDLGNCARTYLTAWMHRTAYNAVKPVPRDTLPIPNCVTLACCHLLPKTPFATKKVVCAADNIGQGSPLEMCYYLGKLQEENYLLSKPPKRKGEVDVMIRVPMLG